MSETLLNNELTVSIPDGFEVMDAEALKGIFGEATPGQWGMRDAERHIVIAVQWYDSGHKLLAKAFGAKDQVKRIDAARRKSGKDSGYTSDKPYKTEAAGIEAWGQDCAYQVEGVDHVGSFIVLKHGSCFYTVYFYARKELETESRAVLAEVMSSLSIA